MDDQQKHPLQVVLDNLDVLPDWEGPSLLEMLEDIGRRELTVIERKQTRKPRPDYHGLSVIKGGKSK